MSGPRASTRRSSTLALRISLLAALLGSVVALVPGQEPASPSGQEEKPSAEALVRRLGDASYKAREAATRELLRREDAVPALRKALHSDILELRRRAQWLLDRREARLTKQRLERLLARVKDGRVDEVVDQMGALEGHLDDQTWKAVRDLARRVVMASALASAKGDRRWLETAKEINDRLPFCRGATSRQSARNPSQLGFTRFLVSQGPVQARQGVGFSIVLANGNVTVPEPNIIFHSIIICDGDVQATGIFGSYVFATGAIKTKWPGPSIVVEQHIREPFGPLRFYDTRQAGIEVAAAQGGLVVKRVLAGTPFGRAGVRRGDRILALDGTKVADPLDFRRRVRRKAMANQRAVLTLQRPDGRQLGVPVDLTD